MCGVRFPPPPGKTLPISFQIWRVPVAIHHEARACSWADSWRIHRRTPAVADTMITHLSEPADIQHFFSATASCEEFRVGYAAPEWSSFATALPRRQAARVLGGVGLFLTRDGSTMRSHSRNDLSSTLQYGLCWVAVRAPSSFPRWPFILVMASAGHSLVSVRIRLFPHLCGSSRSCNTESGPWPTARLGFSMVHFVCEPGGRGGAVPTAKGWAGRSSQKGGCT